MNLDFRRIPKVGTLHVFRFSTYKTNICFFLFQMTTINYLPDLALENIFQYLTDPNDLKNVMAVCSRFEEVVQGMTAIVTISRNDEESDVVGKFCKALKKFHNYVRINTIHIQFVDPQYFPTHLVMSVFEEMFNLEMWCRKEVPFAMNEVGYQNAGGYNLTSISQNQLRHKKIIWLSLIHI